MTSSHLVGFLPRVEVNERDAYGPLSPHSYFADRAAVSGNDASAAAGPLVGSIEEARRRLAAHIEQRAGMATDSSTHGAEFASLTLPQFVEEAFAIAARVASPVYSLFRDLGPIPTPGGRSIKMLQMTTGVSAGVQATEGTAISEATEATATVSAPVATISSIVTVSWQLSELVGGRFDDFIAREIGSAYGATRDSQLLTGSGASGQVVGILATTSPGGNFTDTQASPTPVKNLTGIAKSYSLCATARKRPPTHVIVHPRRWAFITGDATVPYSISDFDAIQDASAPVAVIMPGLAVVLSTDVPTNLGAGTNQDEVAVVTAGDLVCWQNEPQIVSAFDQSGVATGQLVVAAYGLVASPGGNRYPQGVGLINGTDLVAPAGF